MKMRDDLTRYRAASALLDGFPHGALISAAADQARVMHLAELGLEFSRNWLKPDGAFLVKVFQGYGFDEFVREMRQVFKVVSSRKPDASRDRSAELYLLGKGLKV